LWALILQLILSDNLTDLIWSVNRIHKLALQVFVSVTFVGLYDILYDMLYDIFMIYCMIQVCTKNSYILV